MGCNTSKYMGCFKDRPGFGSGNHPLDKDLDDAFCIEASNPSLPDLSPPGAGGEEQIVDPASLAPADPPASPTEASAAVSSSEAS